MLTGSRGSCSRGDICRSYLTANSFMPFSICIFESKLCSSEDKKYLQQNCAQLQRSHMQEMVWPQQIVPHLQCFPSHNPRWKASMSFLLVAEVTISTQQRYFISKQCATLKAHRHFQPFFISFQQACSSYFHYKLCNYSNLIEGLSILFMLKPLSHMHSCTLTHTCTHILREGSSKKPLSSDIEKSTYQIAPPWVHSKHHQMSGCGSFKFKLDQLTSVSFLAIRKFVQLGEWGRNPHPSAVLFEVPTHSPFLRVTPFLPRAKNGFQQLLAKCTLKSSIQQSTKYGTTWRANGIAA